MNARGNTWLAVGVFVVFGAGAGEGAVISSFQEGVSPDPSYVADSTTIRGDMATTPQDNDPDFENIVGRIGSSFMRGIWEFDLSALQSQGGYVHNVNLKMTTRSNGQGADPLTLDLYQYLFPLNESAATWNNPDGNGADPTPGGTLGGLVSSVALNPTGGSYAIPFASTPAFRAAVDNALASSDNTLRLIAARDVESGTGNHFVRFYDEVQAPASQRPELAVTTSMDPVPETVIVLDDGSPSAVNPQVALSGTWNYRPETGDGNKPNSYNGTGSRFAFAATPDETATYTPDLPEGGNYQVALWWPTFDWAENTKVIVNHTGGATELTVDQRVRSGQWNALGSFDFDAGTIGSVVISSEGTTAGESDVGPVADAIRFVLAPVLPLTAAAAYASSSHPINDRRPASNAIDGSGMRDLDLNPIPETHESNQFGDYVSWMSNSLTVDTNPWFAVDLGKNFGFLDEMRVFNFNADGSATNRGVGQADIYYSTLDDVGIASPNFNDAGVWTLLADDVVFTAATGTDDYSTPDVIDLGEISARWIALDIDGSLGGDFVGLSEIQVFQGVPEPSAALLACLGMIGLGLARPRRRP